MKVKNYIYSIFSAAFNIGRCYGLKIGYYNWYEAKDYCEARGGRVARMESEEKRTFLISKFGGHTYWLGGSDEASEGSWVWSDGSPVTVSYWAGSEPNGGTTEDCLGWYGHGRYWFDSRCSSDRYTACSIKVRVRNLKD